MTEGATERLAIIGAGTLGWQMALTFATAGQTVHLHDISADALERGLALLKAECDALSSRGELPEAGEAPARIVQCESLQSAVHGVWLVIEAIPERLEMKRALFANLSRIVGPDVVLATNSSSYRSAELADVTRHPERLLNTHFYGRPWRRPAVELMTCGRTDPAVIDRVSKAFTSCGLRPFICRGESTGFIFNRVWHAVKAECLRVVAEGLATPAEVDELWRIVMGGEPYGPFERMDRVGLDVVLDIERHYAAESGLTRDEPPALLTEMVARGQLGLKTGRGFYDYDPSP